MNRLSQFWSSERALSLVACITIFSLGGFAISAFPLGLAIAMEHKWFAPLLAVILAVGIVCWLRLITIERNAFKSRIARLGR